MPIEKSTKIQRKEPSAFYKQIRYLVNETETKLEDEEPTFFAELWRERKLQMFQLKNALDGVLAHPLRDDRELFRVCHTILKSCNTAWFSGYNDFKSDLQEILTDIKQEEMNLPTKEELEEFYRNTNSRGEGKRIESRIISEAKATLGKELSGPDALALLEKKLAEIQIDNVSGDEIFKRLVKLTEQKMQEKVSSIGEEFRAIIQESHSQTNTMQTAFEALLNELGEVYALLVDFKQAHPYDFLRLCQKRNLSAPVLEKLKVSPTPAQLVAERGLLQRARSEGDLSNLTSGEYHPAHFVTSKQPPTH